MFVTGYSKDFKMEHFALMLSNLVLMLLLIDRPAYAYSVIAGGAVVSKTEIEKSKQIDGKFNFVISDCVVKKYYFVYTSIILVSYKLY